jgi:hypothetical protein
LKEQNAAGSRASEPSAPPYEDKFSHKIKIQSKDGMDSDLVSHEEGQEDIPAHQALRTMHLGFLPQVKRFPTLAKSPLQAALQAACSQGEDTAGFKFYPVLERLDPNDPAMQQIFYEIFKGRETSLYNVWLYNARLLQSVVGDTAMP